MLKMTEGLSSEDKKMINSMCWRSLASYASRAGGQARQMAIGFLWGIIPALNRYYKGEPEKKREALIRNVQFCNVSNPLWPFLMGLVASMEKQNSETDDFDPQSIVAIKAALMGPLSGIGDSFLFSVLRPIAASVAMGFALQGSPLGAVIFLLIYNTVTMIIRFVLGYTGFKSGTDFISKMYSDGTLDILTKGAGILGLIMIGAMTASTVKFATTIMINVPNSDPIALQDSLNSIFIGIVPLAVTWLCKKALDKGININWLMLFIFVFSLVLAFCHIV